MQYVCQVLLHIQRSHNILHDRHMLTWDVEILLLPSETNKQLNISICPLENSYFEASPYLWGWLLFSFLSCWLPFPGSFYFAAVFILLLCLDSFYFEAPTLTQLFFFPGRKRHSALGGFYFEALLENVESSLWFGKSWYPALPHTFYLCFSCLPEYICVQTGFLCGGKAIFKGSSGSLSFSNCFLTVTLFLHSLLF